MASTRKRDYIRNSDKPLSVPVGAPSGLNPMLPFKKMVAIYK